MSGNAFAQVGKRLRSDPNFSLQAHRAGAALAFGCALVVDSVEQYGVLEKVQGSGQGNYPFVIRQEAQVTA